MSLSSRQWSFDRTKSTNKHQNFVFASSTEALIVSRSRTKLRKRNFVNFPSSIHNSTLRQLFHGQLQLYYGFNMAVCSLYIAEYGDVLERCRVGGEPDSEHEDSRLPANALET